MHVFGFFIIASVDTDYILQCTTVSPPPPQILERKKLDFALFLIKANTARNTAGTM